MNTDKAWAMFKCARMILHNQCPPDNRAYVCQHGEECEFEDCTRCWDNYLLYVYNGRTDHPYQLEVEIARKEGRIGKINF